MLCEKGFESQSSSLLSIMAFCSVINSIAWRIRKKVIIISGGIVIVACGSVSSLANVERHAAPAIVVSTLRTSLQARAGEGIADASKVTIIAVVHCTTVVIVLKWIRGSTISIRVVLGIVSEGIGAKLTSVASYSRIVVVATVVIERIAKLVLRLERILSIVVVCWAIVVAHKSLLVLVGKLVLMLLLLLLLLLIGIAPWCTLKHWGAGVRICLAPFRRSTKGVWRSIVGCIFVESTSTLVPIEWILRLCIWGETWSAWSKRSTLVVITCSLLNRIDRLRVERRTAACWSCLSLFQEWICWGWTLGLRLIGAWRGVYAECWSRSGNGLCSRVVEIWKERIVRFSICLNGYGRSCNSIWLSSSCHICEWTERVCCCRTIQKRICFWLRVCRASWSGWFRKEGIDQPSRARCRTSSCYKWGLSGWLVGLGLLNWLSLSKGNINWI